MTIIACFCAGVLTGVVCLGLGYTLSEGRPAPHVLAEWLLPQSRPKPIVLSRHEGYLTVGAKVYPVMVSMHLQLPKGCPAVALPERTPEPASATPPGFEWQDSVEVESVRG